MLHDPVVVPGAPVSLPDALCMPKPGVMSQALPRKATCANCVTLHMYEA